MARELSELLLIGTVVFVLAGSIVLFLFPDLLRTGWKSYAACLVLKRAQFIFSNSEH
jgi:hypothetical protein